MHDSHQEPCPAIYRRAAAEARKRAYSTDSKTSKLDRGDAWSPIGGFEVVASGPCLPLPNLAPNKSRRFHVAPPECKKTF